MVRIPAPYRVSPRCLLHASTFCLDSLNKSSTPSHHQEMDFMKAANILFSEEQPNRKKKFGWDFHLWQAFVACLPSVAVYLTAQYARSEMRRMEAEKEKAEKLNIEEQKQDLEAQKAPGLQLLEERLDKMEKKIDKMESMAAQNTAAKIENQAEGRKTVVETGKGGEVDTVAVRERADAKTPAGSVAEKMAGASDEKKDSAKAQERTPK